MPNTPNLRLTLETFSTGNARLVITRLDEHAQYIQAADFGFNDETKTFYWNILGGLIKGEKSFAPESEPTNIVVNNVTRDTRSWHDDLQTVEFDRNTDF
jgi:hypothetical protein